MVGPSPVAACVKSLPAHRCIVPQSADTERRRRCHCCRCCSSFTSSFVVNSLCYGPCPRHCRCHHRCRCLLFFLFTFPVLPSTFSAAVQYRHSPPVIRWRGNRIKVGIAKGDYLQRLKAEWDAAATAKAKATEEALVAAGAKKPAAPYKARPCLRLRRRPGESILSAVCLLTGAAACGSVLHASGAR